MVTQIAPVSEGVPFLGMRIFKNLIRIPRGNLVRLRKKTRQLETDYISGKLTESELVCSMTSRIAHLSSANTFSLRRKEFERSRENWPDNRNNNIGPARLVSTNFREIGVVYGLHLSALGFVQTIAQCWFFEDQTNIKMGRDVW